MWLIKSLAVFMIGASASTYALATFYPTPNDAYEVGHVRLSDSGGKQDYFKMKLPYPSKKVLSHY
jgi:hypothetical protein